MAAASAVADGRVPAAGVVRWVYLGKRVDVRRRAEVVQGPRERLGSRLQRAAATLRQPFLDAVAEIGRTQRDQPAWWSTTFSWKVWGASDLFLLVCYQRVAHDLIAEALAAGDGLLLAVEDPWLLAQLRRDWAGRPVRVVAAPALWPLKIKAACLGGLRRIAWLLRTVRGRWRQQQVWPRQPFRQGATAAIYSFPQPRCVAEGGGWTDPFLPGMAELLESVGHRVCRFSPPEADGFEAALAARREYFLPLALEATPRIVIRALVAWWSPGRRPWPTVAGLAMDELASREWWTDVARASWCRYRLFLDCARRFLRRGSWEWVIYPFENQPWEKLLALAARECGVRSAGVQHSTLSVNYLSYFLGTGEHERMPLPDVVLTSGSYAQGVLERGGYPPGRVVMLGSLRYGHLAHGAGDGAGSSAPLSSVLVALPIDRPMAEHLISALASAFPDGGEADGIRFLVKPHPNTPIDPAAFGLNAAVVTGALEPILRQCGTVVYVGSTVGPEAAVYGRAVLRYSPELLIDVDVSEAVGSALPVCSDADIGERLLEVIAGAGPRSLTPMALKALFSEVDRGGMVHLFGRSAVHPPAEGAAAEARATTREMK